MCVLPAQSTKKSTVLLFGRADPRRMDWEGPTFKIDLCLSLSLKFFVKIADKNINKINIISLDFYKNFPMTLSLFKFPTIYLIQFLPFPPPLCLNNVSSKIKKNRLQQHRARIFFFFFKKLFMNFEFLRLFFRETMEQWNVRSFLEQAQFEDIIGIYLNSMIFWGPSAK